MPSELRRFLRASADYRLEYSPFPPASPDPPWRSSLIRNIGGGGLMFESPDQFPAGQQLCLKIFLAGWRQVGDDFVETEGNESEATLTAIAEVVRCLPNEAAEGWAIGVKFMGRIVT